MKYNFKSSVKVLKLTGNECQRNTTGYLIKKII